MSDHDESLDKLYKSFCRQVEKEINQMPFYQELRQQVDQLRKIDAKLAQALKIAEGALRRSGARTREALVEAMGRALDAVTARDARGFFEHCGYPPTAQSL